MHSRIARRQLLRGGGAVLALAALQGCGMAGRRDDAQGRTASMLRLAPVRASVDRITRITVCTRPFRAAGPRIETERVGEKTVVHNYGHGGSGWSLSWGSAALATGLAMGTGEREIGVVGCGALGLTTALALQRAGARVTIYTRELPPNVRSSLASGLWTPDSRICLEEYATPQFKQAWVTMARTSWSAYQGFLGLAGTPVEFIDSYFVSDDAALRRRHSEPDGRPGFADLQRELTPDLIPAGVDFEPGQHSLGRRYLHRNTQLMFNITAYTRVLMGDFYAAGGRIEIMEFRTPADLARLREKTLVHATGYGARALFGDESIKPVRGQLTRLIPQTEVGYGLFYKGVSFVPRRDGLVCQAVGDNDYYGYDDPTAVADQAEAERAVTTIAALFA
jgi:glycine/D-amino acid oxidase-like deaminating enzyme